MNRRSLPRGRASAQAQGAKNATFLRHLYTKTIILPLGTNIGKVEEEWRFSQGCSQLTCR
jgi:hypothetical protein